MIQASDADDRVHLRNLVKNLRPVTLRKASRHNDGTQRTVLFEPCDIEDIFNRFIFRALNKRTGIDDDHIRLDILRRDFIARRYQLCQHHLGIHQILGAAERNESDFDFLVFFHKPINLLFYTVVYIILYIRILSDYAFV